MTPTSIELEMNNERQKLDVRLSAVAVCKRCICRGVHCVVVRHVSRWVCFCCEQQEKEAPVETRQQQEGTGQHQRVDGSSLGSNLCL